MLLKRAVEEVEICADCQEEHDEGRGELLLEPRLACLSCNPEGAIKICWVHWMKKHGICKVVKLRKK